MENQDASAVVEAALHPARCIESRPLPTAGQVRETSTRFMKPTDLRTISYVTTSILKAAWDGERQIKYPGLNTAVCRHLEDHGYTLEHVNHPALPELQTAFTVITW